MLRVMSAGQVTEEFIDYIAADLRVAAFEHLLQLSLDYFGAKRTGDLIAANLALAPHLGRFRFFQMRSPDAASIHCPPMSME